VDEERSGRRKKWTKKEVDEEVDEERSGRRKKWTKKEVDEERKKWTKKEAKDIADSRRFYPEDFTPLTKKCRRNTFNTMNCAIVLLSALVMMTFALKVASGRTIRESQPDIEPAGVDTDQYEIRDNEIYDLENRKLVDEEVVESLSGVAEKLGDDKKIKPSGLCSRVCKKVFRRRFCWWIC